jgi:hypothetical protein
VITIDEKDIIFWLCIIGVILLGWCLWHSTSYMLRIEITPYTTNGDVVRAVYPHCRVRKCKTEDGGDYILYLDNGKFFRMYSRDWWKAPYTGGKTNAGSN